MWYYSLFKALHVIGFVSWFAGLFYWVRMFIYHVEAYDKPEPAQSILIEQFTLMENRVYKIIATPAMFITLTFGIAMLVVNPAWLQQPWMHLKLGFLVLLIGYHHYCFRIMKQLQVGKIPMTAQKLRGFNEIATLFLVAIAILAVFKNSLNFLYAFLGVLAFGISLNMGIRYYKKVRERNPNA